MSEAPKILFLKPGKPGMVVRDPQSRAKLPPEGGRVPNNQYWQRRIIAGDAIQVDEPAIQVDEPAPGPITSPVKAATKQAKD